MAVSKTKTKSKMPESEIVTLPGGKLNNFLNTYSDKILKFRSSKSFYIVIAIIGLLLLSVYKKSWFVAAMVNGQPITNLELQSDLNKQFRTQTLNQMVNEKIILDEARKSGAIPTEAEVNTKIADLEKSVGGKDTLDGLLSQQGQTRNGLVKQIRIQLSVSKMYEKEATVSGEEVTQFLQQNKQQLQATDSAGQEKEAMDSLKSQKLSQIFNQKFQELKQKAKIQLF